MDYEDVNYFSLYRFFFFYLRVRDCSTSTDSSASLLFVFLSTIVKWLDLVKYKSYLFALLHFVHLFWTWFYKMSSFFTPLWLFYFLNICQYLSSTTTSERFFFVFILTWSLQVLIFGNGPKCFLYSCTFLRIK